MKEGRKKEGACRAYACCKHGGNETIASAIRVALSRMEFSSVIIGI